MRKSAACACFAGVLLGLCGVAPVLAAGANTVLEKQEKQDSHRFFTVSSEKHRTVTRFSFTVGTPYKGKR